MFCIKKKIYVVHEDELVDLMYERCLVLHSHHAGLLAFDDMESNKDRKGPLGTFNNYKHMMKTKFNSSPQEFHEFLNHEEDLLIIVDKNDYAQLYAEVLMELEFDFGVTKSRLGTMLDQQRLKDFFQGSTEMRKFCYAQNRRDSAFDRVAKKVKKEYKPTGDLFRNIAHLPIEVAYALYKWGNLSKQQANAKLIHLLKPLLESEVDIILESGRHAIASSPEIIKNYKKDRSIKNVDDMIKAIFSDPFLTKVFCSDQTDIDLDNKEEVANVKKLCSIIIEKYSDFEIQPEVDQQELDFFFELYETQDIDVIEKARVNLINTGMMATRQGKFNTGLIMAV